MDLFERVFGISLDGGTGSAELIVIAAVVVVAAAIMSGRLGRSTRDKVAGP